MAPPLAQTNWTLYVINCTIETHIRSSLFVLEGGPGPPPHMHIHVCPMITSCTLHCIARDFSGARAKKSTAQHEGCRSKYWVKFLIAVDCHVILLSVFADRICINTAD